MTNKDKYLKDNVSVEEFAKEIARHLYSDKNFMYFEKDYLKIKNWLNEQVQPTLTEDEKVILKNIDTEAFERIGRNETGHLYLWWEYNRYLFRGYNHLFQFIKERRRIFY